MTHPDTTRVVLDNLPYLVVQPADGEPTVFGPFDPGTEPSLEECAPERTVSDSAIRDAVLALRPLSPEIPAHASTLAERE